MVKEVEIVTQVHAWPVADALVVECTDCGPLGVVPDSAFDAAAIEHMHIHHDQKATR